MKADKGINKVRPRLKPRIEINEFHTYPHLSTSEKIENVFLTLKV